MPCTDSCNHADTTSTTAGDTRLYFHREPTTHELVMKLVERVTSLEEQLARIERQLLRPEGDR